MEKDKTGEKEYVEIKKDMSDVVNSIQDFDARFSHFNLEDIVTKSKFSSQLRGFPPKEAIDTGVYMSFESIISNQISEIYGPRVELPLFDEASEGADSDEEVQHYNSKLPSVETVCNSIYFDDQFREIEFTDAEFPEMLKSADKFEFKLMISNLDSLTTAESIYDRIYEYIVKIRENYGIESTPKFHEWIKYVAAIKNYDDTYKAIVTLEKPEMVLDI